MGMHISDKEEIKYEDSAEFRKNLTGWVCSVCNRYWGTDEHMARYCCATSLPCGTDGCDGRKKRPYIYCDKCKSLKDQEIDQKRLDAAKTCEGIIHEPFVAGGEFYRDLDEYYDAVEQEEVAESEFAFGTRELSLHLDAFDIWDHAIEALEMSTSHEVEPVGFQEFEKAVNAFVAANQNLGWYEEDNSWKFKLPKDV